MGSMTVAAIRLNKIFLAAGYALLLTSCDLLGPSPPDPSLDSLDGIRVARFYALEGDLYAATDDGIFARHTGANHWRRTGLEGFGIHDVAFFTDRHFLASAFVIDAEGYPQYLRYRTLDGGRRWVPSEDNYGYEKTADAIRGFHYDADGRRLWATGSAILARSDDYGRTWKETWGFFGSGAMLWMIGLNPETREVWIGGQGPIENGFMIQHDVAAGSSRHHSRIFPDPSTYDSIHFIEGQPDIIYVSGEGGVAISEDRGETWSLPLGNVGARFYFDIAFDPENPLHLYTAGWTKTSDPQPLILEWSLDGGKSWQSYQHPAPATFFGGVRSMIMVMEGSEKVWYLGLCNGGLMRLTIEDQDGAHPFGSIIEVAGGADHYVGCSSYPLHRPGEGV
jgi:hypothetical protein